MKTGNIIPTLIAIFLVISACVVGCSASSSNSPKNSVSPYDDEFDPEVRSGSRKAPKENGQSILNVEVEKLQQAIDMYDSELHASARDLFRGLQSDYPSSYYAPLFELKIADSSYALGEYQEAIEVYEEFIRLRPSHEAVPYAKLQIANSHYAQYRGVMRDQSPLLEALKHYQALEKEFPLSVYAVEARRLIRECRKQGAAHEAYVAAFYFKHDQENAGIQRVSDMLGKYPLSVVEGLVGPQLTSLALKERKADGQDLFVAKRSPARPPADVRAALKRPSPVKETELLPRKNIRAQEPTKPTPVSKVLQGKRQTQKAKLLEVHCRRQGSMTVLITEFDSAPTVNTKSEGKSFEMLLSFAESKFVEPRSDLLESLRECMPDDTSPMVKHLPQSQGTKRPTGLLVQLDRSPSTTFRYLILDRPHRVVGIFNPYSEPQDPNKSS